MKLWAVLGCMVLLAGCQKPLKVYGDVPSFELTDQRGKVFGSASLQGHVWVADFVFTNCEASCPRMSSRMRALQKATGVGVHLVSFTVDPDRDTTPVLAAYAAKFSADPSRWYANVLSQPAAANPPSPAERLPHPVRPPTRAPTSATWQTDALR